MKYPVPQEHEGERIDRFLSLITQSSRSSFQKAIQEGRVLLNGKKMSKHVIVKMGDVIDVEEKQEKEVAHEEKLWDVPILDECADYLIVNKPAGLLVHPTSHTVGTTLSDLMVRRYPEIQKIGIDPSRPGIVHRLDRDASGIMVIARTQDAFELLAQQFRHRKVKKRYRIVTYGLFTHNEGVISLPLSRSRKKGKRIVAGSTGHRDALTRYWVERTVGKNCSLVSVQPETGRTHQIRVHFFSAGHSLLGDSLYRPRQGVVYQVDRLLLHAELLGFHDGAGLWKEYMCPPGEDFWEEVRRLETV